MRISGWDRRFMGLAEHIAQWSKDPSTKCGAVITFGKKIVSLGFNGFPTGVHDSIERLEDRDTKYKMVLHAEDNALLYARRDLTGCTIYTWPFPPCSNCAAKIIQSRIIRVVAPAPSAELMERWGHSLSLAYDMYQEAGIEYIEYDQRLSVPEVTFHHPV